MNVERLDGKERYERGGQGDGALPVAKEVEDKEMERYQQPRLHY